MFLRVAATTPAAPLPERQNEPLPEGGGPMSGEAVGWAFRKVHMKDPTAKLVLVALANYADSRDHAWPSHDDIVKVTGLSKRAVQISIKKLEDWGLIERTRQFRSNGSENHPLVKFDLETRWEIGKDGVAYRATTMESPAMGVASGATLKTTTKPKEDSTSPSASPVKPKKGVYTEQFEELWKLYPREKGSDKMKAFERFDKLTPEEQAAMKGAVISFAGQMKKEKRENRYIKQFCNFISEEVYKEHAGAIPSGSNGAPPDPEAFDAKAWGNVLQTWRGGSPWEPAWGPEPGQPGSKVPAELLTQGDHDRIDAARRREIRNKLPPDQYPQDVWEGILLMWKASALWPAKCGPKPGEQGCLVPIDLLEAQEAAG
jgi:hypothetical protein